MPLTAAGLIDQARECDPTFVPHVHPDTVLLKYLSRYQRTLVSEMVTVDPSAVADVEQVTLPLAVFADGHTMTANVLRFLSLDATRTGTGGQKDEVKLVAFNDRHTTHFFPACYFQAGVLYLVGRENEWQPWSAIDVYHVPLPATIAGKATPLILPDTAEDLLVACLCDFMARRTSEGLSTPAGVFREDMVARRAGFMELHHQRGGVAVTTVEEVW